MLLLPRNFHGTEFIFNLISNFFPLVQYLLKRVVFSSPWLGPLHLIDIGILVLAVCSWLFVHHVLIYWIIWGNVRVKSVIFYICTGGAQPGKINISEREKFSSNKAGPSLKETGGSDVLVVGDEMMRDGELRLEIWCGHLEKPEGQKKILTKLMTMTILTLNCSASKDDLSGAASLDSIIIRSSAGCPRMSRLQGTS